MDKPTPVAGEVIRRRSPKLPRWWVSGVLSAGLLLSLAFNFLLYRQSIQSYVELQRLSLDPTSARRFGAENESLAATRPTSKRIIFFGDSRIAMWHPLPSLPGCQLINRGVGGETTAQLLARLDRDVIRLHPDVVLIEMGVNNLKTLGVFPDQEGEIIKSCNRETDLILQRLCDNHIRVVMLTVFPVGAVPLSRRAVWSDRTLAAIVAYNQRLRGLNLPGLTVLDCDPALSVDGRMNPKFGSDSLHLSEAGYEAFNKTVAPVLSRVLRERPSELSQ
jgi:lysophospholipase L1-like esterase